MPRETQMDDMRKTASPTLSRRRLIEVTGAAAAALPLYGAKPARAEIGGDLTIANWGGDWNDRCVQVFEAPIIEKKGIKLVHDLQPVPERKAKLLAEQHLPRGTIDVVHLSDADAFEMNERGVIEPLDLSRLPNYQNIRSNLRLPYLVTWIFGGIVMMYNPNKIAEPPTSFADLWNPKYAGRVGLMDQLYFNYIYAASLTNGGTMGDVQKAFPALLDLKKAVQPRLYASHQTLAAGFANEEVWISAEYSARIIQWIKEGLPVQWSYPKEGAVVVSFGASLPKRGKNRDTAYFYLNEMLSPQVTAGIAEATSYAPGTTNSALSTDLRARLDFTPEQAAKMNFADYAYAAKNDSSWVDWWNKNMKG